MAKYFLSTDNINTQCAKLEKRFNLKDKPDSRKKCRMILTDRMKQIYSKYGTNIPSNIKIADYIDKLNAKAVSDCEKMIKSKTSGKTTGNTNIDKLERERAAEVYGNRQLNITERPEYIKVKNDKKPVANNNDNNYFAIPPVQNNKGGQYVTPTGEIKYIENEPLEINIQTNIESSQIQIEKMMAERSKEYGGRPTNMQPQSTGQTALRNPQRLGNPNVKEESFPNLESGYGDNNDYSIFDEVENIKEEDTSKLYNKALAERNVVPDFKQKSQRFDPSISPHINQNIAQNLNKNFDIDQHGTNIDYNSLVHQNNNDIDYQKVQREAYELYQSQEQRQPVQEQRQYLQPVQEQGQQKQYLQPAQEQGQQRQYLQALQQRQPIQGLQQRQPIQGLQQRQPIQGAQGLQQRQPIQGLQQRQPTQGSQGLQQRQPIQGLQQRQDAQGAQGLQQRQPTQGSQGLQQRQPVQGLQRQPIQGAQGLQQRQPVQGLQRQPIQGAQGLQQRQPIQGAQGLQQRQPSPDPFFLQKNLTLEITDDELDEQIKMLTDELLKYGVNVDEPKKAIDLSMFDNTLNIKKNAPNVKNFRNIENTQEKNIEDIRPVDNIIERFELGNNINQPTMLKRSFIPKKMRKKEEPKAVVEEIIPKEEPKVIVEEIILKEEPKEEPIVVEDILKVKDDIITIMPSKYVEEEYYNDYMINTELITNINKITLEQYIFPIVNEATFTYSIDNIKYDINIDPNNDIQDNMLIIEKSIKNNIKINIEENNIIFNLTDIDFIFAIDESSSYVRILAESYNICINDIEICHVKNYYIYIDIGNGDKLLGTNNSKLEIDYNCCSTNFIIIKFKDVESESDVMLHDFGGLEHQLIIKIN